MASITGIDNTYNNLVEGADDVLDISDLLTGEPSPTPTVGIRSATDNAAKGSLSSITNSTGSVTPEETGLKTDSLTGQLPELVQIQSTSNYQPNGSEFRVDTGAPTTRVTGPQVATAANGDFVVVWQTPFSNTDTDIYFRRFNANGTAKDSFDRSVTTTTLNQFTPAVAMAADGKFVVSWTEINASGDQDVYFQRFSTAGDKLGTAVLAHTADTRDQFQSDITMFDNGDFVITWTNQFSATDQDVLMRGFRSDGTPFTSQFTIAGSSINEFDSSIDVRPIAEAGATSVVVTYTSGAAGNEDVFFQRYDGNLSFLGSGLVNTTTANSDDESSVALDGSGNFAVAWTHEFSSSGGDDDIRLRRFNANGTALTSSDQIVAQPGGDQDEPAIAMSNDGRFVVAYEDDTNETVKYLEYSSDGTQVGVAQNYDVNHSFEDNPAIAINGNGAHMVIAADDDFFNSFDPTARKFQSSNQNDFILGGGSNDIINGGFGNDFYDGRGGNDTIKGDIGNDTVLGGLGNDLLVGGPNNDSLIGGAGKDTLNGATGADILVFNSKSEGIDTITNFSVVDDTIQVSKAGFGGGLIAGAAITAAQFRLGSKAADSSDRFIYNKSTGALLFDPTGNINGTTDQVQFASLSPNLGMTNKDIFVIA